MAGEERVMGEMADFVNDSGQGSSEDAYYTQHSCPDCGAELWYGGRFMPCPCGESTGRAALMAGMGD